MIETSVSITRPPNDSVRRFAKWVAKSCTPDVRVLEIGAGEGRRPARLTPVFAHASTVVGVDPDVAILQNRRLVERHHTTLEQFSASHPGEFDVALAVFVLEHVVDPHAFVQSCARVLAPGGRLFALTMNLYQYFGLATWAASRLHISDRILLALKGQEVMDRYHFATQYRLNTMRRLSKELDQAGFASVEYRCFDQTNRFQWYLPNSLRWFPPLYTKAVYAMQMPSLMGHLSLCAIKAAEPRRSPLRS